MLIVGMMLAAVVGAVSLAGVVAALPDDIDAIKEAIDKERAKKAEKEKKE